MLRKYRASFTVIILALSICSCDYYTTYTDKKNITEFSKVYDKYEALMVDFIAPVLAANLGGEPEKLKTSLDVFGEHYKIIMDTNTSRVIRLVHTKEAMLINQDLISQLDSSEDPGDKAGEALLDVNKKAAAIRNDELKKMAFELADLGAKKYNSIVTYRKNVRDKRKLVKELLDNVIQDNGDLTTFWKTIVRNKDKVEKINGVLENMTSEFGDLMTKSQTIYARFKGMTRIK